MKVLAHIREQYGLSLGSYGRPRMAMELKEVGLVVGERRVGRLMRINGIRPVRTRKHKVTTNSNHRLGIAANWLDGDFVAAAPNQKWAGDITYIWTAEGWLYLAVVLDLHSRRVVGWAVSDRMTRRAAWPTRIWQSGRWRSKQRWHNEISDRRKTVTSPDCANAAGRLVLGGSGAFLNDWI